MIHGLGVHESNWTASLLTSGLDASHELSSVHHYLLLQGPICRQLSSLCPTKILYKFVAHWQRGDFLGLFCELLIHSRNACLIIEIVAAIGREHARQ